MNSSWTGWPPGGPQYAQLESGPHGRLETYTSPPPPKMRVLYTLTVNGIEIEAEEKVWRALRAQLVDLFGVYDPSTPREER